MALLREEVSAIPAGCDVYCHSHCNSQLVHVSSETHQSWWSGQLTWVVGSMNIQYSMSPLLLRYPGTRHTKVTWVSMSWLSIVLASASCKAACRSSAGDSRGSAGASWRPPFMESSSGQSHSFLMCVCGHLRGSLGDSGSSVPPLNSATDLWASFLIVHIIQYFMWYVFITDAVIMVIIMKEGWLQQYWVL